ncbi:hypothetical protein AGOR_G00081710 [Albula goreensis]|uniref:Uncharacterized protein n=1 Tax=Albula goreensis TaxID=1534307 RepID=A0A8T3DL97_9TELE|nr:hypothetical protein AGOR_G00081710 [Albula goreensis]
MNSRDKIENRSPCNSTLTVKLQQKDNNREWRCQLTEGSDVKISHSFTTILAGTTSVRTTKTTSTASPPISSSTPELPVRLTVFFLVLIIPLVIGAAVLMRRRSLTQTEQARSGVELKVLT